jgi:hypothetical protein
MSRREGISRSFCNGISNRSERGIEYPRTRNSKDYFEPLIDDTTNNACHKNVVALALADAPIEKYRNGEEEDLFAYVSDGGKEEITDPRPQSFKNT